MARKVAVEYSLLCGMVLIFMGIMLSVITGG